MKTFWNNYLSYVVAIPGLALVEIFGGISIVFGCIVDKVANNNPLVVLKRNYMCRCFDEAFTDIKFHVDSPKRRKTTVFRKINPEV